MSIFTKRLLTEDELRLHLKAETDKAPSKAAWARAHGLTPQHVRDVLNGYRGFGPEVQDALGFERVIYYQRKA